MTFRELRLWHWNQCRIMRGTARGINGMLWMASGQVEEIGWRQKAAEADALADFHLRAVQLLNNQFGPDDHVQNEEGAWC